MSAIVNRPYWLERNPTLTKPTGGLVQKDFLYYDKDGFELCTAEYAYYCANDINMHSCLNHTCCQQDWFAIEGESVFTDHALILHRYDFSGEAREQLISHSLSIPQANWLLQTNRKWGFDLAVDAIADNDAMYEVVHIEHDDYFFDSFEEKMIEVKEAVVRMDWERAASQVWSHREKWMYLKGFHQNHWKAKYLFGWNKAEYTEKAI